MRRISVVLIAILSLSLALPRTTEAAMVQPSPVASYAVGPQPFAVVGDASDGRLYVANSGRTMSGHGTISVVDPATGFATTIATSKPSGFLALDTVARRLYSSNYDPASDSVSFDKIDLTSGSVVGTLAVGGLGVALDPEVSRLFVASARLVFAVDPATFSVAYVRFAPGTESWFGVAVDPALHHVYVTNIDSAHPSLVVLDDRDLSTLADIALPTIARFAIAVDTDTHRVYVAGSDPLGPPFSGSGVYALDGNTLAVVASSILSGFPGGIALSAATHRLYVTDMYGSVPLPLPGHPVNEIDTDTLAHTLTLISPGQPALATIGPDARLYVTRDEGNALDAYDLTPRNSPPVIDSVTVSTREPRTNDLVTANVIAHDPDGDPLTVSYQWGLWVLGSQQPQPIPGETSATLDLSKPGNGDLDNVVCISYVVSDGQAQVNNMWCFAFVLDTAPTVTVSLAPASPTTNSTLQATAVGLDADQTPLTYAFTWRVNGAVRRTVTTGAGGDAFDLSQPYNGDKGDVVSVEVVASDGRLSSASAFASTTVANSPPSVAVALSSTTPGKRDVVTATVSVSDADGDALSPTFSYTYTWRLNGAVLRTETTASTTSSFDLRSVETEYGDAVSVTATASDGTAGASASATATVTVPKH